MKQRILVSLIKSFIHAIELGLDMKNNPNLTYLRADRGIYWCPSSK